VKSSNHPCKNPNLSTTNKKTDTSFGEILSDVSSFLYKIYLVSEEIFTAKKVEDDKRKK
jgi:hypothetical protein